MKKYLLFLALVMLPLSVIKAEDVRYLTTSEFKQLVFDYTTDSVWHYRGDVPCIIDFYTTWCGPCKRLAPVMEELANTYCDQVIFYKVDTEKERELAYYFQITSIPTILFVPVGERPQMAKGCLPKETLVQAIKEVLHK
ncbi:MAG: thioredoxin [Paludibacteraceae bacterium]|nr:thioredoxin [Paludibacteraceae bacterium]